MADGRYSCFNDDGKFINIPPIKDIADILITKFTNQEKENDRLREENKILKAEAYKDTEIARLKEENDRLYADLSRGFEITEDEAKLIDTWKEKHELEVHDIDTPEKKLNFSAIGGTYGYHFLPSSIGTIGYVRCSCGEEFTFRDI